tara:strand:+ start:1022 stop:1390 length:369 start_codon:yes stop_codon:yes gene_type:complete
MNKIKFIISIIFFLFVASNILAASINKNELFKNIRCLVCQGQSIADSNSDFARTVKLVINDQIKDGKTEKEIYKFLVEKYGEWIVYKPPLNKYNFILWFFPYFILIIGGFLIYILSKKKDSA